MFILSYANNEIIHSKNYKNSLKLYKYKHKIIGKGEKWESFITKIKGYHDFLERRIEKKGGNDIICITDCYDVLAAGPSSELQEKYASFSDNKVVFSAECNCLPRNCIPLDKYWEGLKKLEVGLKGLPYNKYLNSGFIIGPADKLLEIMKFTIDINKEFGIDDDQLIMCMYAQKFPEKIKLDTESYMIGTVHYDYVNYDMVENKGKNRVTHIPTGNTPCFIHTPGMNSDMCHRLDYFGEKILGSRYLSEPKIDKISSYIGHIKKNKIQAAYLILAILLLSILVFFIPMLIYVIMILFSLFFLF